MNIPYLANSIHCRVKLFFKKKNLRICGFPFNIQFTQGIVVCLYFFCLKCFRGSSLLSITPLSLSLCTLLFLCFVSYYSYDLRLLEMKMCDEQIRISSTGSSVWVSHSNNGMTSNRVTEHLSNRVTEQQSNRVTSTCGDQERLVASYVQLYSQYRFKDLYRGAEL